MRYLQPSFTVESPGKVFGCEACIYGETHGYPHTFGEGCQATAATSKKTVLVRRGRSLVGLTIPDRSLLGC